MRFGWIVIGTLIGLAVYYRATLIEADTRREFNRDDVEADKPETAEQPAFEKPLQTKHAVQPEETREPVAALIDEVVHSPKVADGPMKQAFEQAIHHE